MATALFHLDGNAAGDYSYAYKPGGVDYFRSGQPITNKQYNSAQSLAGKGPRAEELEAGAPALKAAPGPGDSNGTAGGKTYADRSNSIAMSNAGLSGLDTQLSTGIAATDTALGGIIGRYNEDLTTAETKYTANSDQNQNNLQRNKQSSLVNAAQGRRGLFGTLASLGALNGSGVQLANRAVAHGANEDLAGAADAYQTNQTGLTTAIEDYRRDNKRGQADANTAATNAKTNIRHDTAEKRQAFYSRLAGDYADQGNAGEAKRYTNLASSLYPEIATASVPSPNLAYNGSAFTAPALSNYLVNGNTQVSTTNPVGGPGYPAMPGLFAGNSGKKKLAPV